MLLSVCGLYLNCFQNVLPVSCMTSAAVREKQLSLCLFAVVNKKTEASEWIFFNQSAIDFPQWNDSITELFSSVQCSVLIQLFVKEPVSESR